MVDAVEIHFYAWSYLVVIIKIASIPYSEKKVAVNSMYPLFKDKANKHCRHLQFAKKDNSCLFPSRQLPLARGCDSARKKESIHNNKLYQAGSI